MFRAPGYPPLPILPVPEHSESFDSAADVEPYEASDGSVFVPIVVGRLAGYYSLATHKVVDKYGVAHTPTAFECAGGKENNRKWRLSLRVLLPDGTRGKTLGQWLVSRCYDHMVPSPNHKIYSSSPKKSIAQQQHNPASFGRGARRSASLSPTKRRQPPSVDSDTTTSGSEDERLNNRINTNTTTIRRESPTKIPRRRSMSSLEPPPSSSPLMLQNQIPSTDLSPSNLFASFLVANPVAFSAERAAQEDDTTPIKVTTPILNASMSPISHQQQKQQFYKDLNEASRARGGTTVYHPLELPSSANKDLHPHSVRGRDMQFALHPQNQVVGANQQQHQVVEGAPSSHVSSPSPSLSGLPYDEDDLATLFDSDTEDLLAHVLDIMCAEDDAAAEREATVKQQEMPWLPVPGSPTHLSQTMLEHLKIVSPQKPSPRVQPPQIVKIVVASSPPSHKNQEAAAVVREATEDYSIASPPTGKRSSGGKIGRGGSTGATIHVTASSGQGVVPAPLPLLTDGYGSGSQLQRFLSGLEGEDGAVVEKQLANDA